MFASFFAYAAIIDWDKGAAKCTIDGVPTLKCLENVVQNLLTAASGLVILFLFIMFIIGSYQYLTSLGSPERVKKAQGTLKFAVVGFVLFISAFLILKILDVLFLGGCDRIFKLDLDLTARDSVVAPCKR